MKFILYFLSFVFCLFKAQAQELPIPAAYGHSIAIGAIGDYNFSKTSTAYYIGMGGFINLELPLKTVGLNITAFTGYVNFFENRVTKHFFTNPKNESYPNLGYIIIKPGLKYYFTTKYYACVSTGVVLGLNPGNNLAFDFSPGVGVALPINLHGIDISVQYESWTRNTPTTVPNISNIINCTLAYKFGLDN